MAERAVGTSPRHGVGNDTADQPPRILQATTRCFPELGGIESHVAEVAPRLAAADYDITIVATDRDGTLPEHDGWAGVLVRRFRAYPRRRDYYASPGLFGHILRDRYDLLHVQGIHTLVPPVAMLAAYLRRRPYIVTFHTGGTSSRFRARARSTQFRLLGPLLRRAGALIAVSEFEAQRFEGLLKLPAGSIRVIRNGGALPPSETPENPVVPDPDLILSVGRLERYKGHHRAIAALPHLHKTKPNARLRIVGAGPAEQELRQLAYDLGVAQYVSIEFIPPEDRAAMYATVAGAGASVLLSDYEAHPVAVMESLALARPVVVLETSGMTELVRLGWAAGVPADAAPTQIAGAIAAQLDHPVRPEPASLPTWDRCVAQLDEVYRDVLSGSC